MLGDACERICVYTLNNAYTYLYIFWELWVREFVYIPLTICIQIYILGVVCKRVCVVVMSVEVPIFCLFE